MLRTYTMYFLRDLWLHASMLIVCSQLQDYGSWDYSLKIENQHLYFGTYSPQTEVINKCPLGK